LETSGSIEHCGLPGVVVTAVSCALQAVLVTQLVCLVLAFCHSFTHGLSPLTSVVVEDSARYQAL
jgi:hypothetical protein